MAKRKVKQKYTKNQQQFIREQKRIQNFIRRKEREGFSFEPNLVPTLPKRVTKKAIQEIKSITPNVLYSRAEYIFDTGEFVSAREALRMRRSQAQRESRLKKQWSYENAGFLYATDNAEFMDTDLLIIKRFQTRIHTFFPLGERAKRGATVIEDWLLRLVRDNGEHAVAMMLLQADNNGVILTFDIVYNHEKIAKFLSDMMTYLYGQGDIYAEEILEIYEAYEYTEDWESIV